MSAELRQLRYFVAVAEEANLSRAATRLYLTQQALSVAVRQLEQRVGTTLFVRTPRGVVLTAGGEALLDHARRVLHQADLLDRAMREHRDGRVGRLRVGLLTHGLGPLTPPVIAAFRAAHPRVAVSVRTLAPSQVTRAVLEAGVDAALVYGPQPAGRLRITELFTEPRIAAVPAAGPLADAAVLTAAELVDRPVGARHPGVPAEWEGFFTLHAERGGDGERLPEPAGSFAEVLWNINLHGAVLTLPAHLAGRGPSAHGVRYVPAPDLAPVPFLLAQRHDDPDPLAAAFRDTARRVVADLLGLLPGARPLATPG